MDCFDQIKNRLIYHTEVRKKQLLELSLLKEALEKRKRSRGFATKAKIVIQEVAKTTQKNLEAHVSNLVSLCLFDVFEESYKFVLEFVPKRGKTEGEMYYELDGEKYIPNEDSGIGVLDVAAFALRIACWYLKDPKTRKTIWLDEPFKHLDASHLPKASQLLKSLSRDLGIQFVVITHSPALAEAADKVFNVTKKKKISVVMEAGYHESD